MERFTKRLESGDAVAVITTYGEPPYPMVTKDFVNRLAEYEDLEEDGRLIKLPCKVGDKVWIPFIDSDIAGLRVQSVTIGPTGKVILNLNDYPLNTVWGDEIGKTIYLSKEEAEKHLTDESKKYII